MAAYQEISIIWETNALPRFPPLPAPSAGPSSVVRPQEAARPFLDCATHGASAASASCERCGTLICEPCQAELPPAAVRCPTCRASCEAVVSRGLRWDRAQRLSWALLVLLAVGDMVVALNAYPLVAAMPLAQPVLVLLVLWGIGTLIVALVAQARGAAARWLLPLACVPHLQLFPVGTIVAVWLIVLNILPDDPHPLSEEFATAAVMAGHSERWPLWVGLVLTIPLIPVHVLLLEGFVIRTVVGLQGFLGG